MRRKVAENTETQKFPRIFVGKDFVKMDLDEECHKAWMRCVFLNFGRARVACSKDRYD